MSRLPERQPAQPPALKQDSKIRRVGRRLVRISAIPASLLALRPVLQWLYTAIDVSSNVDWVYSVIRSNTVRTLWEAIVSPAGTWITMVIGLVWLVLIALRSDRAQDEKEEQEQSQPKGDRYKLEGRPLAPGVTQYRSVEYLDPKIELMHFGFDPVGKNERGFYVRVGKDFSGERTEAAILDFQLKPVRDAVPWIEARAHVLFKDEYNQHIRVSAGVWLGRDQPKVPIRPGETQSLILTGGYTESEMLLTTYEHGPRGEEDQRIERNLDSDSVRVAVSVVAEYMDEPRFEETWYFRLTKVHSRNENIFFSPIIERITQKEFEKRLRLR